jgi:phospholipid-binding lipoprotein MlaA
MFKNPMVSSLLAAFAMMWLLVSGAQANGVTSSVNKDSVLYVASNYEEDYLLMEGDYLTQPPVVNDPIESINRGIFSFNRGLDQYFLRPVSATYKFIIPPYFRRRVTHFLDNFRAPVVFANSLLQGDAENTFVTFWRFTLNSTLGVLGLFDIATELGVPPRREEDFGQTLAVWGAGEGPYLMLPVLGPSNLRDLFGFGLDILVDPTTYNMFHVDTLVGVRIAGAVDFRSRHMELLDNTYAESLDPYATFRSLYQQRRESMISDSADASY